jgi:immunity protein, SdpI family
MNDYIKRWYPAALALAACAVSLAVFDRLPDSMAVHWDLAGNPNGWMPKTVGAFITPGIILVSWLTLRLAPLIDPRRPNYEKFTSAYDLTVAALLAMVFVMHLVLLAVALGYPLPVVRIAPALIGAVFVVVGNVMPRARSNFMFGIRTPWTLSNERVWARTHRLAGYTMTGAGVVMILSAALLPPDLLGAVIVAAIVAALVAPAVYSYLTFRRESKA